MPKSPASQAPPDAPLGQWAFPAQRKGVPAEPDTAIEKALFLRLQDQFLASVSLPKKEAELLKTFLQNGWYSKVFKEPKEKIIMRGMAVDKKWLARALKKSTSELGAGNIFTSQQSFTFKPRQGSSSWTTSTKVANQFTTMHPGACRVIMYAYTAENPGSLLVGKGGLYSVGGLDVNNNESEVLALGPVKVFKLDWEVVR